MSMASNGCSLHTLGSFLRYLLDIILLIIGEATCGLLCPALGPPVQERHMDVLERVQWRVTTMLKGPEHLSFKERLRELGLEFSLVKRRLSSGGSYQCL